MPVTVIVGGQFGSEGKGKVAHFLAKHQKASAVIRVGGPNSGHTVIDEEDQPLILKHLSTAAILPDVKCILTAGHYIDLDILQHEIQITKIDESRLLIDPFAMIITPEHKQQEAEQGLVGKIGSTGCGLGAAVGERIGRQKQLVFAKDVLELSPYIAETNPILRKILDNGERILLEGTQGFGLSLLHSNIYPFNTSRDTTAAGFLSEAGLSPFDVDDVVLVIRAFPIRVAGNSGPLIKEIDWDHVSRRSGSGVPFYELTSVSKKIRRVAEFDSEIVCRAISYNKPTTIVLNHADYFDKKNNGKLSEKIKDSVSKIENSIGSKINYVGLDRKDLIDFSNNNTSLGNNKNKFIRA